jgi:hypothetical protein
VTFTTTEVTRAELEGLDRRARGPTLTCPSDAAPGCEGLRSAISQVVLVGGRRGKVGAASVAEYFGK